MDYNYEEIGAGGTGAENYEYVEITGNSSGEKPFSKLSVGTQSTASLYVSSEYVNLLGYTIYSIDRPVSFTCRKVKQFTSLSSYSVILDTQTTTFEVTSDIISLYVRTRSGDDYLAFECSSSILRCYLRWSSSLANILSATHAMVFIKHNNEYYVVVGTTTTGDHVGGYDVRVMYRATVTDVKDALTDTTNATSISNLINCSYNRSTPSITLDKLSNSSYSWLKILRLVMERQITQRIQYISVV